MTKFSSYERAEGNRKQRVIKTIVVTVAVDIEMDADAATDANADAYGARIAWDVSATCSFMPPHGPPEQRTYHNHRGATLVAAAWRGLRAKA